MQDLGAADDVDLKADLRNDAELLVNNLLQHFDAINIQCIHTRIDYIDENFRLKNKRGGVEMKERSEKYIGFVEEGLL